MDLQKHFKTFSTDPACRIIIDSCSDADAEEVRRLGVDLIEFPFVMADGEHIDDQFESMSPEDFYGRMSAGERVLTSAIPTGQFAEIFRWCAEREVPTLYLSFTAGLSSSVHDAQQAASMVLAEHPGFQLIVLDNRLPSMSAALLAEAACAMRDQGVPMARIADWCRASTPRVHGYFTLGSLDWLVAGGRVPKAAASLSAVLGMKANLTYDLDGALTLTGVSRGRKKAVRNLADKLRENYENPEGRPVGIVHANCPEDAEALACLVRQELGPSCPDVRIAPLDPTIGAHVGPGMIAIVFWGRDRSGDSDRGKR